MKCSIYTMNGSFVYQRGNTRVIDTIGSVIGQIHQIKEHGEWRKARGYCDPLLIEKVKEALGRE